MRRSFFPAILVTAAAFLPIAAFATTRHLEPWIMMWALAVGIFFACKLLMLARHFRNWTASWKIVSYLFFWPGMDPRPFRERAKSAPRPPIQAWLAPAAKLTAGILLLGAIVPTIGGARPLAAAWFGMAGIVLVLHFGLFHLLTLFWQLRGVPVRPLMETPFRATSLADFWGGRWNRPFSDLSRDLVYRPLWRRIGPASCTMLVFLISGLVHDLVISAPSRGGYGLPTLYFLVQGIGLLVERSAAGRRLGFGEGLRGRVFALTVLAAPLFWLFHPAFIERVVLPFLKTIQSL